MATNPFSDPNFGADLAPASTNPFSDPNFGKQKQNKGTAGDLATSLKIGIEQLPGQVTGLLDIPSAAVFGTRPYTKIADALGKVTGFQPEKWANEAQTEYSQKYQKSQKDIGEAWDNPNKNGLDIAEEYAANPAYVANQVVNSLPSMLASGAVGKGLMMAGRTVIPAAEGVAAKVLPGTLEKFAGKWAAPIAGGIGEGSQQAGQQMAQYKGDDQRRNAVASVASGAIDALISGAGGRLANKFGFETAETAMAKAFDAKVANELTGLAKYGRGGRMLGGALSEGILQELPQSAQEQVWQNWSENKPLWDGIGRQAVEGAMAGFVMGAGANVRGNTEQTKKPSDTAPQTELSLKYQEALKRKQEADAKTSLGNGAIGSAAQAGIDSGAIHPVQVLQPQGNVNVQSTTEEAAQAQSQQTRQQPSSEPARVTEFPDFNTWKQGKAGAQDDLEAQWFAESKSFQGENNGNTAVRSDAGLVTGRAETPSDNTGGSNATGISGNDGGISTGVSGHTGVPDTGAGQDRVVATGGNDAVTSVVAARNKIRIMRDTATTDIAANSATKLMEDVGNAATGDLNAIHRVQIAMQKKDNAPIRTELENILRSGVPALHQHALETVRNTLKYAGPESNFEDIISPAVKKLVEKWGDQPKASEVENEVWVRKATGYSPLMPKDKPFIIVSKNENYGIASPFGAKPHIHDSVRYFSTPEEGYAWANKNGYKGIPAPIKQAASDVAEVVPELQAEKSITRTSTGKMVFAGYTKQQVQDAVDTIHSVATAKAIKKNKNKSPLAQKVALAQAEFKPKIHEADAKGQILVEARKGQNVVPFTTQQSNALRGEFSTTPKTKRKVALPKIMSMLQFAASKGGFNRDSVAAEFGNMDDIKTHKSGIFGMPSFRATGGETWDSMGEMLAEAGYLPTDEHGKYDKADLEEKLGAELSGDKQYAQDEAIDAAKQDREASDLDTLRGEAEQLGIKWQQYKNADDLYVAIDAKRFELSDAEEKLLNEAVNDDNADIDFDTGDFGRAMSAAETNTWLEGIDDENGTERQAASTPPSKQGEGNQRSAERNIAQGETEHQTPTSEYTLTSQTAAEIKAKEDAQAAQEAADKVAEDKRKADAEVGTFQLAGQGIDANQDDMFGNSPAPKTELDSNPNYVTSEQVVSVVKEIKELRDKANNFRNSVRGKVAPDGTVKGRDSGKRGDAMIKSADEMNHKANELEHQWFAAIYPERVTPEEMQMAIKNGFPVRETKPAEPIKVSEGKPAAIEDFGEKIEGAKKDLALAMKKDYTDADLAGLPLSKIWPANLAEKIDDPFVAALAYAARDEIPSKPQKEYRVKNWVSKVKILRGMVDTVLGSDSMRTKAESLLNETKGLAGFNAKVKLLSE